MTEESTKIQKMQMAVRELLETSSKPSASMKWTTPILAELEVVFGEIIENLIGCEYGLKLVKAGYFQVFGALRENALFLDIAVSKAAGGPPSWCTSEAKCQYWLL